IAPIAPIASDARLAAPDRRRPNPPGQRRPNPPDRRRTNPPDRRRTDSRRPNSFVGGSRSNVRIR
ncbi:MAG: hypothetical protein ACRDYE_14045, partial [Acidimicrobiales bacterium]